MKPFENRRILITGGTGSLGKVLVRRLLSGEMGLPAKVIVFSRDEAKQHFMRVEYQSGSRRRTKSSTTTSRGCSNSASATCAISAALPRRSGTPTLS